jgi:glycerophosphoryl diester phosphodiesterase
VHRTLLTLAAGALLACSSSPAAGPGGAGGGGSGGAGGKAPVIDPKLFDCSAPSSPERSSPVPIACVTDVACATPMIAGHRGAGGDLGVVAPENTVSATRAAIALGIELVETDPRPTKDGVLVNMHDDDVSRVTTGVGNVSEMTYAELRALTLKTSLYPGDFSCEHIATLEEILTAAKGKIHVLVDANKTDRVDLLVQAILDTETLDWAIFDTSSDDKIDEALAIAPTLHTMIRVESAAELDAKLAHFATHPPILVEASNAPASFAKEVLARKQRPFIDVFIVDGVASATGELTGYGMFAGQGYQILQTDRPDLVKKFYGR